MKHYSALRLVTEATSSYNLPRASRVAFALSGILVAGFAMFATPAYAQSECEEYQVKAGDSLRMIAAMAYGDGTRFNDILDANRELIESSGNAITVGMTLEIPCVEITVDNLLASAEIQSNLELVGDTALLAWAPTTPILEGSSSSSFLMNREIRFLTGSNYAPFTDRELENGGLFTELVETAINRADDARSYSVTFDDSWSSHVETMLPAGDYDLGFPWFKPNCDRVDRLSDEMAELCNNYNFSDPFFEVVVGYYARKDNRYASAQTAIDLIGARVCRPNSFFTFDLEAMGLVAPAIELFRPETPEDCFVGLRNGEYDVVTMNAEAAERATQTLGTTSQTVALERLASIQTMHVIAPKMNPVGRTALTLLNKGLHEMAESGEWFSIASRHLGAM